MSSNAAARSAVPAAAGPAVIMTRLFDAPRALVFEAWSAPAHLARWWGPNGFSLPRCEVEFRPGGPFNLVMRGPDGNEYPMDGVIREVVRPERIVFTAIIDRTTKDEVFTTVTFEEEGGKTRLTVRQTVPTDAFKARGQVQGWTESLERLAAAIARQTNPGDGKNGSAAGKGSDEELVLTHVFDSPRELVFKAWTDPDHLKEWWGPKGFTWLRGTLDLKTGGLFHYGLRSPNGQTMWGRFVYWEIVAPSRLVFVVSFSDEKENVTRHPTSAEWPLEVLNILTFEELEGRTTLTLRGVPVNATEAERKAFKAARASVQHGFKGTLDQLAAHLARG